MLAHIVFFTLKDASAEKIDALVAACQKYLADHEGCVFFAAGKRNEGYAREVNDKTFHVALHVVFQDTASHDLYQEHPRHKEFIAEQKENWATVRVFDSDC